MKIFESKPTESTPLIGNSSSPELLDRVTVYPQDLRYKNTKKGDGYYIDRKVLRIGNETIVITGPEEDKDGGLIHMPEGYRPVGSSAKELIEYVSELVDSEYIDRLLESVTSEKYTQDTREYCDAVCAALCIGEDGEPLDQFNTEALADVLEVLLGNSEKAELLRLKIDNLHKYRKQHWESKISSRVGVLDNLSPEKNELSELQPENVVLVRVTKNKPQFDDDGNILIYPAANYDVVTESEKVVRVPRGTIHFSVNARVEDHVFNEEWEGDDNYVIVCNFGFLVERGTLPITATVVDTYFESSPGEPLILPRGSFTIVEPKKDESLEDNKKRAQKAMREQGAKDIFEIGEKTYKSHSVTDSEVYESRIYDKSEFFIKAFNKMCIKLGIPDSTLHFETNDAAIESYLMNNIMDPTHTINPRQFMRACQANQRWAALLGRVPVAVEKHQPTLSVM